MYPRSCDWVCFFFVRFIAFRLGRYIFFSTPDGPDRVVVEKLEEYEFFLTQSLQGKLLSSDGIYALAEGGQLRGFRGR